LSPKVAGYPRFKLHCHGHWNSRRDIVSEYCTVVYFVAYNFEIDKNNVMLNERLINASWWKQSSNSNVIGTSRVCDTPVSEGVSGSGVLHVSPVFAKDSETREAACATKSPH
jgi:hypothetical protein